MSLRRFQLLQEWFQQYDAKWKIRLQRQRKKDIIEAKVGTNPKEISAASNAKQASAKKAAPGINGAAKAAFWSTSKAIQTESIEALILPFSKIIREGPTVYYFYYVTTLVNGQIQRFNVHGLIGIVKVSFDEVFYHQVLKRRLRNTRGINVLFNEQVYRFNFHGLTRED